MKQGPLMLMMGSIMLTATIVASQSPQPSKQQPRQTTTVANHPTAEQRGQKVFEQNCSRCHNSPEGFPPNISSTIATHMRVRAGLSEADYKALLRYLNP
jgi:cytochrome c5